MKIGLCTSGSAPALSALEACPGGVDSTNASPPSGRWLDVGQELVKRPAIDQVGQQVGIFVLPPEMARMGKKAVVGAIAGNERQGVLVAGFTFEDFSAPAFLHVLEKIDGVALVVGN